MLRHPGGEKHSRYLIELAFLEKGTKWLDMGAGDGGTVHLLRSLGYCAEGIDFAIGATTTASYLPSGRRGNFAKKAAAFS